MRDLKLHITETLAKCVIHTPLLSKDPWLHPICLYCRKHHNEGLDIIYIPIVSEILDFIVILFKNENLPMSTYM